MKKHNILISAALSICAVGMLLPGAAMTVSAQRQYENCIKNCRVYDVEGVFDEYELAQASTMIQELSESIDMYVAVYIYGSETQFASDYDVARIADDNYDALFNPQYNVDTDGLLLLINNSTNYDYISTSGMGQLYFSNSPSNDRIDSILSDISSSLKEGDYLDAITEFCVQVERYYDKGYPANAYTYDSWNDIYYYASNGKLVSGKSLPKWYDPNWFMGICMALGAAVITGLITGGCIKSSYKLKKSLTPTNYICHDETIFHVQEDLFLRQYRTRTQISSSSGGRSGGGGGGSSHRSSGGHSHGGGGRHR